MYLSNIYAVFWIVTWTLKTRVSFTFFLPMRVIFPAHVMFLFLIPTMSDEKYKLLRQSVCYFTQFPVKFLPFWANLLANTLLLNQLCQKYRPKIQSYWLRINLSGVKFRHRSINPNSMGSCILIKLFNKHSEC